MKKIHVIRMTAQQITEAVKKGAVVIAPTPPRKCELCGNVDETRPYGPNGEEVCFECGQKDQEALKRGFEKRFAPRPIQGGMQ